MSVTLKLENQRFNQAMKSLLREVGPKKMLKELNSQIGVLVKNATKLTPPTGNSPISESLGVQKKAGINAIKSDITQVYKPFPSMRGWQPRFKKSIEKMIRQGRLQEVSDLLNRLNFDNDGVIKELTTQIVDKNRDRRGRQKKDKQIFVIKKTTINRIIKLKQKKVGYAKSGWARAVKKFKAKGIGKWATDKGGKGFARTKLLGTMGWEIVFGNKVKYAGRNFGSKLNIMSRALKTSRRGIMKKIDILLKKGYRKSGF